MFVRFFKYIQYLLPPNAVARNSHIWRITNSRCSLLTDFWTGSSFFHMTSLAIRQLLGGQLYNWTLILKPDPNPNHTHPTSHNGYSMSIWRAHNNLHTSHHKFLSTCGMLIPAFDTDKWPICKHEMSLTSCCNEQFRWHVVTCYMSLTKSTVYIHA